MINRPVNRDPKVTALPAHQMRSFELKQPLDTHFRTATCEEVNCTQQLNGFMIACDPNSDMGKQMIYAIENVPAAKRSYTKAVNATGFVEYTFPPGQRCFRPHRTPIGHDPIPIVRDGDFRGNPTGQVMRHTSLESWHQHAAESLDTLYGLKAQG